LTKCGHKLKKSEEISKPKLFKFPHALLSSVDAGKLSVSSLLFSVVLKSCNLLSISLSLILQKSASAKSKWCSKSKVKVSVINLNENFRSFEKPNVFSGSWAVL
jgi:hypothetical protein